MCYRFVVVGFCCFVLRVGDVGSSAVRPGLVSRLVGSLIVSTWV